MDRPISNTELRKNNFSQILKWLVALAVFVGGFFLFRDFLKTEIKTNDFRIMKVERGTIENAMTAAGQILPSFEQQVNAPISTEIKKVLLKSGKQVKQGDVIMTLDKEYIRLDYESLQDQLELKKNNVTRLKYEFDKNIKDLDYEDQIKALQLASLTAKLEDVKHLKSIGGATRPEVEQAELNLQIAQLEKKKLENDLAFRRQVVTNDRRNLELEVQMQEKKLTELSRKLKETSVIAPRAGVITWVNENIGKKVTEGEALARIANLESYRVEASCSDRYANRVKVGQPVKVRINRNDLQGTISSILPSVANNTIEFLVELAETDHKDLRPNMRVEIFIISDKKEDVLRIANGAAFKGGVEQELFVLQGEQAIKKKVRVGLSNADFVEITQGDLKEGDLVILSDMEDYDHLDIIELKK